MPHWKATKHTPALEERLQKSKPMHDETQAILILALCNFRAICLTTPIWSGGPPSPTLLDTEARASRRTPTCAAGQGRVAFLLSLALLDGNATAQRVAVLRICGAERRVSTCGNSLTKHPLPVSPPALMFGAWTNLLILLNKETF